MFERVFMRRAARPLRDPACDGLQARQVADGYQVLTLGFVQHPLLVRYGLLLCAFYYLEFSQNSSEVAVAEKERVIRAVELVRLAFEPCEGEDDELDALLFVL